ncbi:hypothetical protein [Pseudonocardia sp. N23]|uniref:hypothetical protein n=1 Tax=Pseudonocardia sp. N23 TaxID=1987376 RepID=UPI000BFD835C|nr:hypothetical protein [Pseudonocardia sp. N23]GAY12023.1 hypothetical protein TOK_0413 [Pseudonocardia sp. N23]
MAVRTDLTIYRGDTYLSPWWVVVVDGAGVDLADPGSGWTVKAQARRGGTVVIDWGSTPGATLVAQPWTGTVGTSTVETTAVRLYLTPAATALLEANRSLAFDIELSSPDGGPLDDAYRVTLIVGTISITKDVTE